ncbi:MAG: DNA-binding transcriptional regulator [Acidobacteria bacterium]|nr:MAG: DNA-binding transcriptional regulator [Acidobacteriota bacterium]
MRADRLLSALLLLQAHGRLTGRQLAKRLEVSARTVHRDMEALSASGVPVFALRGARGGWQLDEDWRTRVPGLDESELRALLMAQPRMIGDARLARAAERALEKLMAALPVSLREQAASIRQRLYVDPTGWRGTSENLAMLPIVQDAVARDRKIAIRYWRADRQPVERTLDPLGLVAKGNTWYLVARSADRLRTYRVSRIEEAKVLDRAVERPADFDLALYWRSSTKEFEEAWPRCDALLRLEPHMARWMKTWRAGSTVEAAEAGDPAGWVRLRVTFDHPSEACFVVLGLGPRADVIEPASLRERVAAEAAAVVARGRQG